VVDFNLAFLSVHLKM